MALLWLTGSACGADPSTSPDSGPGREAGAHAGAHRDAATNDASAALRDASADAGARDGGAMLTPTDTGTRPTEVGPDYASFEALSVPESGVISLSFDVPQDAVSFVLTADPGQSPRLIALRQVIGPDGETIFDSLADTSAFDPASDANLSEPLPYSLMMPSSPELPLAAGRYGVRLLVLPTANSGPDAATAPVSVDVVLKRAAAAPTTGTLSVVLWFAEGAAIDGLVASSDPPLQAALEAWRSIYAKAGITLAPFEYRDLLGSAAASLSTVADDAALADLLDVLAQQAGAVRALHVVFVDSLLTSPGKTVFGRVSGLPGPPAHPVLARRGAVVVPLDRFPSGPDEAGALLAHEAAHYLGLRHTSEFDGVRHDPIADTDECPTERATGSTQSGAPALRAADCADLDGTNLLFYTTAQGGFVQDTLTPGQAFVLLRNPLVR